MKQGSPATPNWLETDRLLLSVLLTGIFLWLSLLETDPFWHNALTIVIALLWGIISLLYFWELVHTRAEKRKEFIIYNWLDLLLILFPILFLTKIINVTDTIVLTGAITIFRLLFWMRFLVATNRFYKLAKRFSTRYKLNYVIVISFVIAMLFGIVVASIERTTPGANITSATEGLWWAFVTMTTVGYGDFFPITPLGRLLGMLIMVVGITTFSVLTANIAAFLRPPSTAQQRAILRRLDDLQEELAKKEITKPQKSNRP